MENKSSTNIETIDFADSQILSYTIKPEYLMLFIERWNAEILEIKFLNFASISAMSYFRIAEIKEIFESPLLERVLTEFYEEKPKEHNYRIFKFITGDDDTALEIVFENLEIRIIKKMIS